MVEGIESEYLHAKERAILMLGLGSQGRYPTNRKIRDCIERLTRKELGPQEMERRVREMREIAAELMLLMDAYDPFLIGSTLSGQIRQTSDIDLHAYCDNYEELKTILIDAGYQNVDEELVENQKGSFVHLKWDERDYPIEITVYPWSMREVVPISSVTGKPMKRADLPQLARLLRRSAPARATGDQTVSILD